MYYFSGKTIADKEDNLADKIFEKDSGNDVMEFSFTRNIKTEDNEEDVDIREAEEIFILTKKESSHKEHKTENGGIEVLQLEGGEFMKEQTDKGNK